MITRGVIGNNRRFKKAELKITFGLIFTLILIVFFVIFAFASIKKSIVHHDDIIAAQFLHDLDVELQDLRNHEQGFQELNYELPEDINHVYFEAEPEEEVEEGERRGVWVHFNNTRYPGRVLYFINIPFSGIGEDLLILNVTNSSVKVFLVKKYRMGGAAVSADGELAGRAFYVGAPQNHGTYQEILNDPSLRVLFNLDFENSELGLYPTMSDFRRDWKTGWSNRGEFVEIVPDPSDPDNQAGLITFPFWGPENYTWVCWGDTCHDEDSKRLYFDDEPTNEPHRTYLDGVGPGSGGFSTTIPLGGEYDEVYLSYNIKYEPDWNAPAGGKIPGLNSGENKCPACEPTDCMDEAGNMYNYEWDEENDVFVYDTPPDGIADDFSARHMFQSNDHISYYYYDYDKVHACGDSVGVGDSMIFDGDWHNIVLRVRMNDIGSKNGVMETWIDGENHGFINDILFKTEGSTFGIGAIAFSNFFGGGGDSCEKIENRFSILCSSGKGFEGYESWARSCAVDKNDPCGGVLKYEDGSYYDYWSPRQTEYIHFDDIIAYTTD